MDTLAIIVVVGTLGVIGAIFIVRMNRAPEPPDEADGDCWPYAPQVFPTSHSSTPNSDWQQHHGDR